MSDLSTLPKGDSAWLLRKAIERIIQQVSVLETNIGSSTTGNSANTQIIFNDNGTLRGDTGLVFNKTTDALTVAGLVTAGSATITGDLTVATSALKVDSTTGRVAINTATFASAAIGVIQSSATRSAGFIFNNSAGTYGGTIGLDAAGSGGGSQNVAVLAVGTDLSLYSGNALQHKISNPGVFNWYDGAGGTRMTLNSTGLGIGESPVSGQKLSVNGAGSIRNGSGLYFWDTGNSTAHGILNTGDNLTFVKNNSTASMTLDASGNLLVNTTTVLDAAHLTVACTAGSGSKIPLSLKVGLDSAGYVAVNLRNQTGSQGTIVVDVTGVRYLTASDYRLKEVLGPISGGLNRVNALKPSVYKWKVDGSNGEGFIAHELAEVVPAAVNGLKDAVNEDGTINPQNVDMSRIVPILVAAIQELTARVQTLEAR